MYNLFVSGNQNDWCGEYSEIDISRSVRHGEYTEEDIADRLGNFDSRFDCTIEATTMHIYLRVVYSCP